VTTQTGLGVITKCVLLACRGRRTAGLAYVVTYSLSCCTKHSPNFWVLMVGRVLGGIATSLLYSAFESWLVAEHFKHGFSGMMLLCYPFI
jgi:predicted MFS family arabinose efflux permease